jgi:hypothetical protein
MNLNVDFESLASWITSNNWPIVVIIVALIFRNELKGIARGLSTMSSRVTRLGALEFQAQDKSSSVEVAGAVLDLTSIDVLDNDVALKPFYDHFARAIEDKSINPQERFPRAVRAWAFTARARAFDQIMRVIRNSACDAAQTCNQAFR